MVDAEKDLRRHDRYWDNAGSRPERCSSPEMGERGRKSGLAGFIRCRWMPNGVRGSAEPSHGADPLPDRDCAAERGSIWTGEGQEN
jgi:hypothetical protein